ncbi:hypothetical protein GJ496_005347 [Pomphorhynchus laevis]|nr:hypothetical protein GJ496_005347 [Pomphorhynchus laevis]
MERYTSFSYNADRQASVGNNSIDHMDELNCVIDCLNSTKRFNMLMRGGVLGSPAKLWRDLNPMNSQDGEFESNIDNISNNQIDVDDSVFSPKLSTLPMPKDLRDQMSLLSVHLAMGILRPPVDRAWIAVDDHLFLWDITDDDLAFFDLDCVALHVDFCSAMCSARHPKHTDVNHFLFVVSCNVIKIFELRIYPTICILFSKENSVEPMYQHKTPNDQMISVACLSNDGRLFYGTRDGRIFELVYKFSSFWGNTCKTVELSGFGQSLMRSVFSPMFFTSNAEEYSRQVEQICYSEPNLLIIRRKNQVQCADLNSSWSLQSITNLRTLQIRALCIETFNPFLADNTEQEKTYIFIITELGSRMVVDASNMQIIVEQPRSIDASLCSSAYVDPSTGICILQRKDDGAILYSNQNGSFQKLLEDGMVWSFINYNNDMFLKHSRLMRPKLDFLILTTNQAFIWTIPPANDVTNYRNMSNQDIIIALADILYPYWNRSLAVLYESSPVVITTVGEEETAYSSLNNKPIVSSINSNECQHLKRALHTIAENCSNATEKASDLCRLVGDVFACWYLISVEHQLHAVVEHITENNREDLLKQSLKMICQPSGQQLITSLLNGLIQLYLDDRAATDALLARLKLISPKFFSPDAALLAQASDLLQKCASLSGTFSDHSRNTLSKEAINLLLRAAGAVDLDLWAPALVRLKLYRELVSLTVMIAMHHMDPQNLAFSYYLNNLNPDEDIEGFRLMQQRVKLYNTMLDAAHIDNIKDIEDALLANHDDQLAHILLFDRFMNAYNNNGHNNVAYTDDDMNQSSNRLSDTVLHKLNHSPYFVQYLHRCTEQEDIRIFALRSICRLYEIQRNYTLASDMITRLALTDSALDISERIALLNKALLNARNCNMKESANRVIDLENYLDVAFIQLKIADRIKGLSSDDRNIRYGNLLDLTTLFQTYADPFNLYDCQLALLCMVSHSDFQLVTELWCNICSTCSSDGDYIHSTFSMLRNGINDERYVPVNLLIKLIEERAKSLYPKVKYPGWSIEILSKYLNTATVIRGSRSYFKIGGAEFIRVLSDYVISSGDAICISQMINLTKDLIHSDAIDPSNNSKSSSDIQKLTGVHRLLEKSKQHLIFS